jgi:peroxiredoxin
MGEPKHAQRYCGKLLPDATCLIDETALAYGAYGLTQGTIRELASLSVIKASARALIHGHMQGKSTGDTRMLPGTFIIDQSGVIRYSYYSEHAGDHPHIEQLSAAAKSL